MVGRSVNKPDQFLRSENLFPWQQASPTFVELDEWDAIELHRYYCFGLVGGHSETYSRGR